MVQSKAARSAERRVVERALQRRAARVCRREVDAALAALDAAGEFTPEQRAALRTFAERLSHGVLAEPLAGVRKRRVEPETAAALFEE